MNEYGTIHCFKVVAVSLALQKKESTIDHFINKYFHWIEQVIKMNL